MLLSPFGQSAIIPTMDYIFDITLDAVLDTLKLIPFLFLTYLAMEAIEQKSNGKAEEIVQRAGFAGPIVGSLVGAFPQCGFSAAASTLYAAKVITVGTLISVYLATSDELLPILIAEQADPILIAKILGIKVAIGMLMGFIIDAIVRITQKDKEKHLHICDLCERDNCGCDHNHEDHFHNEHSHVHPHNCKREEDHRYEHHDHEHSHHDHEHNHEHGHEHHGHSHEHKGGIARSALVHTVQVTLFIFVITLGLNAVIGLVGEDALGAFLSSQPALSIVASAMVGLIPNCASSVVITELFLEGTISTGSMLAGLLVAAGVGLLVLFRSNRPMKNNVGILVVLFLMGVFWGSVIDLIGIVF